MEQSIKVTNMRMHKLNKGERPKERANGTDMWLEEVPIAEGKFILFECKPEEALFYCIGDLKNIVSYNISHGLVKGIGRYLKPIIISETEKIIMYCLICRYK